MPAELKFEIRNFSSTGTAGKEEKRLERLASKWTPKEHVATRRDSRRETRTTLHESLAHAQLSPPRKISFLLVLRVRARSLLYLSCTRTPVHRSDRLVPRHTFLPAAPNEIRVANSYTLEGPVTRLIELGN